ncbi:hypothetical protein AM500_13975 [Bacillus sp. FJAT-18017]|uniref:hypothetical protein n=1 Tax=Bacillus sp. FJAT-18017 TaxID=1705566 RepID=UPI0006AE8921|nr:hypothetical protein [Bacillus sp. FJAT-18017]ALC90772.1 hypothetical protein AM500_13975 [Bacillus sp. FJAT-18017]
MIKKIVACLLILGLLTNNFVFAETNAGIEIFDITQEKVIKTAPVTPDIQQEAAMYLKGITGLYPKINPIPKQGFMIRIPLDPKIKVENQWFNNTVDEVIVIFPVNEDPFLLLFDGQNKALFFNFKGDTGQLMNKLNFKR